MDEMRINSRILKKIISRLIERTLRKKLGIDPTIQFNDEIRITMDEDDVYLHLNVDVMCKSDELDKLIGI